MAPPPSSRRRAARLAALTVLRAAATVGAATGAAGRAAAQEQPAAPRPVPVPAPAQPPAPPPALPHRPDTVAVDTAGALAPRPTVPAPDPAPPVRDSGGVPRPAAPRGAAARAPAALAPAAAAPVFTRERLLAPPALPVTGGSPAEVLQVQVLLDAAGFSPGMLDGRWGENMRLALAAFRAAAALPDEARDWVDAETHRRLVAAASGRPPVTTYPVSAADVRGPYRPCPRGSRPRAAPTACATSRCSSGSASASTCASPCCARSTRASTSPPCARATGSRCLTRGGCRRRVASRGVVVDKDEGAVRGLDAAGAVLFWLPATVGSGDMPSPHGLLRVQAVERNPVYRWDPAVLRDVSRRHPVRYLPSGPNNMVGLVWVALSRPHVGIHGTPTPETIGYAASHGCVRLTNWDAVWFSGVARPGLPVEFR